MSSLVRCLLRYVAQFAFLYFLVFLSLSLKSSLCVLDHCPLSYMSFTDVFHRRLLRVCGLSSHSLDTVFHRAEVFEFNEVQIINYFFHGL